ncbi:MAG: hypothetical protein R3315_11045, partial [Woeseiaceae bacterium]|nr:hypothetical protein [Woeseiaceae bacterium]
MGLLIAVMAATVCSAAPLDPPTPEALAEGRRIVQEMRDNPRGPYLRIRWFCNDGTTQPPVAYACREHGGGRQHAEYSPQRARLAELGWHVGTIFAAVTFEELFDAGMRQDRLRELPLERYLIDIDDGWVLKRARDYRGRTQIEDEVAAGARLLEQIVSRPGWAADNFLLVRELTRTVPHGADSDLARTVRRDAVRLAELDPAAEAWRAEIHSHPDATTGRRLRAWATARSRAEVVALATELADNLELLYGAAGRDARARDALRVLTRTAAGNRWQASVMDALNRSPHERIVGLCAAHATARTELFTELDARGKVALLDALQELETSIQLTYQQSIEPSELSRRDLLALGGAFVDCAFASG